MKISIFVLILFNYVVCKEINFDLGIFEEQENYLKHNDKIHQYDDSINDDKNGRFKTGSYKKKYGENKYQFVYDDFLNKKSFSSLKKENDKPLSMKRNILYEQSTMDKGQNEKKLSNKSFKNNTLSDVMTAKMSNFSEPMANNNGTNELEDLKEILNQIYGELETIKTEKMCSEKDPDGNDCDINGIWNSAEIGLRIELSTSSAIDGNKLHVNLTEKIPKKQTYRIDTTWICSGSAVHKNSGPFYFHCTSHQSPQSMIIFHGICKRCSGFNTIFGEWIFQHIPSDCRQLWTFSETKRDVFHKNLIHHLQTSSNDNASNNQTRLYPMNKNNDTINSKPAKFRRNSKYNAQKINQDLFYVNIE